MPILFWHFFVSNYVVHCYEINRDGDGATNRTFKKRFVIKWRKGSPTLCMKFNLDLWTGLNVCYSGLNSRNLTVCK